MNRGRERQRGICLSTNVDHYGEEHFRDRNLDENPTPKGLVKHIQRVLCWKSKPTTNVFDEFRMLFGRSGSLLNEGGTAKSNRRHRLLCVVFDVMGEPTRLSSMRPKIVLRFSHVFSGRTILTTTSDRRAPHRIELQPFSVYVPASKITPPHTHVCMYVTDRFTHARKYIDIWIRYSRKHMRFTVDGGQLTKKKLFIRPTLFAKRNFLLRKPDPA